VRLRLLENSEVVIDNLVEEALLLIHINNSVPKLPILTLFLSLLIYLVNVFSIYQPYILLESNYALFITFENISEEYLPGIHKMGIAFHLLIIV